MRFWDSSALVPLLVRERASERLKVLLAERGAMMVWWATPVECTSAIVRRERAGDLRPDDSLNAQDRLSKLMSLFIEVQPSEQIRSIAQRMLRVHPLRAADSCQLAAAVVGASQNPGELEMVCLDERLARAAQREGFRVFA